MQKKILVLGVEQNNFLSFLYSSLKLYNADFKISAPFIREINKSVQNDSWMYENDAISQKKSLVSILKALFSLVLNKHTFQTFFFILFVEGKFKKSIHFLLKQVEGKAFFIQNNNFIDFDTFHFHYMQYSYLRELFFVPKNKKIVCTFWGSDLMRTSDILNFFFVKKALNLATTITCQSQELKEIILSKYGRNLEGKIEIAFFPVERKIYERMDFYENETEAIHDFKVKYQYSLSKINILIGHNGNVLNNHIKILEALNTIQNKDKVHLIVNLNYGLDAHLKLTYKAKLTALLEQSGMSYILLETFFSKEELAISRLATDGFIHMPISDALSGTMLEMMYASNIVITGTWLPYKTFKNCGLQYHEVSNFKDLSHKTDSIIDNFITEKEKVAINKSLTQKFFFSDSVISNWAQILN